MKHSTEILAPAGGEEQLKAAVRSGADAVYLGTGNFNARRNADNFREGKLFDAVKYCHSFGVKVYVTLNTLIYDYEINALYNTVKEIAESGADAVIVQDFAVAQAVKSIAPEIPLHASTQMAVHNLSGALFLQRYGFKRAVLAREMSLAEIEAVSQNTTLETEVFIHGAHCMSCSGNCYISALFGERSGNRGKCAQVCRLDWRSRRGNFALSLKDMSYLDSLDELKNTGVTSFKIEGRMKRPEYVAAAVNSAVKALNGDYYDYDLLRSVFSRSGFTDGYLKGKLTSDMFGYRQKEDVTSAAPVFKELQQLYGKDNGVFPISFTLTLKKDKPAELTAVSNKKTVTVYGDIPETPVKAPLSKDLAERNLSKLGGTPFVYGSSKFYNDNGLTLSSSAINALRRSACEKLTESFTVINRTVNDVLPEKITAYKADFPKLRVRFENISQYSPAFRDVDAVILPLEEILNNTEKIKDISAPVFAELPFVLYTGDEQKLKSDLKRLKETGVTDVCCGNIGELYIAKTLGMTVHGTHGFNITNTYSLNIYEKFGLADTVLSFEMNEKQINSLGESLKRGILSYGYLPAMTFRACPQKTEKGCNGCNGISCIRDRKNIPFTLICHGKKYSTLHNSVPLYIGDKKKMNVDFELLYFTTEAPGQCHTVFECFKNGTQINGSKTSGIYYRELL